MQICKQCGKQIKYIATSKNESVTCDDELTIFYTYSGKHFEGFKKHVCKKDIDNGSGKDCR